MPEPSLRICYYHQDHLGSSTVISENQGAGVEEAAYYPFGRLRNENHSLNVNDPYRFTQKEQDKESGLHYFSARFLASHLSRFATADPKYAIRKPFPKPIFNPFWLPLNWRTATAIQSTILFDGLTLMVALLAIRSTPRMPQP